MPGCRIQPLLLYNRITSSFSGLHKQLSSCWFSKLLLNIGDDSFVPLYFTARLALADQRNLFCLPSWWLVDTSLWPLNWRPHIDKAKCWPVSSTRYYPRPAKGERTLVKASLENPLTKKKKKKKWHGGIVATWIPFEGDVVEIDHLETVCCRGLKSGQLDVHGIPMKWLCEKFVSPNLKGMVTAAMPLKIKNKNKKQNPKSCPKHMQCDPCLLLSHGFYNHLKAVCENCRSWAAWEKQVYC